MITEFTGRHRFLSNFSPSPFEASGRIWPTVEHFYQAHKAITERDRAAIHAAPNAAAAKRLGNRLTTIDPDWNAYRLEVMRRGLVLKFQYGTELGDKLLATKDELLIEGNGWGDAFWGAILKGEEWVGANWLGMLLMVRRAELRGT